MKEDITCAEVLTKLNNGEKFHFFDVREEWEHDEENIGAQCYPLGDLPDKLQELEDIKKEEIIVHCQNGPRGNRAKKYLTSQGFENVRNMIGGLMAFQSLQSTQ